MNFKKMFILIFMFFFSSLDKLILKEEQNPYLNEYLNVSKNLI